MKIAFDENVPIAMVKVFQTFANERQLRKKVGSFEITSATEYTPKPSDGDYVRKNDAPWIKRFAVAGGKVIISGDTEMRYVPHERLALIQAGMLVFFFDGKWSQWDFFRKCSLLIHHWPAIASRIKRGKAPAFWHIPLSWHEKAKLRKVSTDDPKKLKIERRAKPQRPARKRPPATKTPELATARELTLLDLMVAPKNEVR
ncbi:hypothetical protein [Bradyrhizobium sp. USDA 329]|uniref:PIN-like domain-containing protein n=1 Tax=unclassified Bradyrhizobium TaxID=2631580 RepID=UPI0035190D79